MPNLPYAFSDPDKYSRLVKPFSYLLPYLEMERRMKGLAETLFLPATPPNGSPIFAGYTYFGQLIFHELTSDSTPIQLAGVLPPDKTQNERTSLLELDSVYGDGPQSNYKHLYAADGSFVIGNARTDKGAPFDVPIHLEKCPVVDSRNIENAITRQIHALFLLLHNVALRDSHESSPDARFRDARRRVKHQFQWLVRYNFLETVCDPNVLNSESAWEEHRFVWPKGKFSIPVEFAQAVGRFGHSMVRADYHLTPIEKGRLFLLTELFDPCLRKRQLPAEMALDWLHFFGSEPAMWINTEIVDPLQTLIEKNIALYVRSPSPDPPFSLAERTLKRGLATSLATGQQICKALRLPHPTISLSQTPQHQLAAWRHLQEWELVEETPLWYYILLEAELIHYGRRLGPLGSRLLIDVVDGALADDPDPVTKTQNDKSHPFTWNGIEVKNLVNVATVVGL